MKPVVRFFLLFLAVFMLGSWKSAPAGNNGDGWVYEREKKGIKIFTRKGKWGHLRDSKADMIVHATPEQMLAVLTDFEHYSTWFPRCKKSKVLAHLSENEFIIQMVFSAPWPIKDRDCVVRVKITKDQSGAITLAMVSEPKYYHEEKDVVRIQQLVSTWKLIPKEGGTEIINEYASNPGGDIPDWMVNTQSVEQPMNTFENLQQKAAAAK